MASTEVLPGEGRGPRFRFRLWRLGKAIKELANRLLTAGPLLGHLGSSPDSGRYE